MIKKIGLCKGRHDIGEVEEYIFEKEVNPLDIEGLNIICIEKLKNIPINTELYLYVTGLTVALVTVINYCSKNHMGLTLFHYDKNNNSYYPQPVLTQVDCDLLKEGGYSVQNNLQQKYM